MMGKLSVSRRGFMAMASAVAASLVTGGMLSACSSNEQGSGQSASGSQQASTSASTDAGSAANAKVLVAYYSAQGHTKRVAETAADELGADLFEIVPQDAYSSDDLNWSNDESRVTREHEDESLRDVPLAQTTPDNWADYDTVLFGYPIWWAIAAWPCDHFATDNDFTGKKVIPFCTSASSELGQSGELLASAAGTGDWQEGQRFSSSASDDEVRTWAAGL